MNRRSLFSILIGLVLVALTGMYFGFRTYAEYSAEEVVNTVMRSEAAAIQQGNLLNSLTKLQASISTSESLAGVSVFDLKRDPTMTFPLILIGRSPEHAWVSSVLFDRTFSRTLDDGKAIIFFFQPRFIFWSFVFFGMLTLAFSAAIILLVRKMEGIRIEERAATFTAVAQQIVHDVKSPLSAIKIFSGVAARKGMPTEVIDGGISRIEDILADLRSRSAELNGSEEVFSADKAVVEVVQEKRMEHPGRSISLATERAHVKGASSQFKRAISNLLNNAIEASSSDSEIDVQVGLQGQLVNLSIRDGGKGIPKNLQPLLFRRGYTAGKEHGSGLGLSHAQSVVKSMNGQISLESEEDKGTVVSITLPVCEA